MSSTPEMGQSLAQTTDQLMAAWIAQALAIVIRGVIACFPQERVEKVLILFAGVAGQQLGHVYGGDQLAVARIRKAMKDNFVKAMNEVPAAEIVKLKNTETASIGGS